MSVSTWQPKTTGETSSTSYWINWRVLVCAMLVLLSMGLASFLISKFEGTSSRTRNKSRNNNNVVTNNHSKDDDKNDRGVLYADEVWKACIKGVHPCWLLGFRVCAFLVMLILLIVNAIVDGPSIFFYYTQWTFTLVTIYFGLGSVLSMYGCYEHHNKASGERVHNEGVNDTETGDYMTHVIYCLTPITSKYSSNSRQQPVDLPRPIAGFWGYTLQIIYQMNAGAVMLTDMVFWFIIVPFLTTKNYDLNFFIINMHTVNLVFLLGDTALNCLHFPWFRIAYFILWTSFFVIFQWVLHACVSIWWPYPFLDLSSSYAPLWYSTVAVMHIPCYGIFFLIIKLKHFVFTTYFPLSYL